MKHAHQALVLTILRQEALNEAQRLELARAGGVSATRYYQVVLALLEDTTARRLAPAPLEQYEARLLRRTRGPRQDAEARRPDESTRSGRRTDT